MRIFKRVLEKKPKEQIKPKPSLITFPKLYKTDEMIAKSLFWEIISKSLEKSHSQNSQEDRLIELLLELTPQQMIGFRLRTDKLLYESYTSEMWCAAYLMNGGCSDDGFEYFRCWVISLGQQIFEKSLIQPDTLIDFIQDHQEIYEFEDLWYVAIRAFENKTGKNLFDYIDYETFTTREGNYPTLEFNWQEEDPESMKLICPELFKRFWVLKE